MSFIKIRNCVWYLYVRNFQKTLHLLPKRIEFKLTEYNRPDEQLTYEEDEQHRRRIYLEFVM